MLDNLFFAGIFVSVTAFVIFIGMTLTRTIRLFFLMHRVRKYLSEGKANQNLSIFKYAEDRGESPVDRAWYWNSRNWLQDMYDQSGITWSLSSLIYISCALIVCFVMLSIVSGRYLSILLLPIICSMPILALKHFARRKNLKIASQLPAVFSAISRMVRSGQTVQSAMRVIADDFPDPVRAEFLQCYEQQNLGVTKEHALRRLASRTGIIELRMFAVAIIVQNRFGGDISELLQSLAEINRSRMTLRQRMKALTAEGRMQAIVLSLLPLAAFGVILVSNPDYIAPLLSHPKVICATVALQIIGIAWIVRIIRTDY